jgi:glycosyltransferase involved in cell wall biosynthesis
MMTGVKVVILHALRREGGGARRLSTWERLCSAVGARAYPVSVLPENRLQSVLSLRATIEVVTGRAPIETVLWDRDRIASQLADIEPDVVICMTLRTLSPAILGSLSKRAAKRVVVDLVDPLSKSYTQRSQIAGGLTGVAFRVLARDASRSEILADRLSDEVVVAGWDDAKVQGARWIPIVTDDELKSRARPPGDDYPWHAVFVGSLDYPPNIDAVERLTRFIWPRVRKAVPEAVLAIAGRRPNRRVKEAVTVPGIRLVGPFADFESIASKAAVAVSPLSASTGFQIKVLDAAQVGLPQVVTGAALKGFSPGFPARVADGDEEFADAVVELLHDSRLRQELADAAHNHAETRYCVESWEDEMRRLLGNP